MSFLELDRLLLTCVEKAAYVFGSKGGSVNEKPNFGLTFSFNVLLNVDDLHMPLAFSDVQTLLLAVVVVLLSVFRLYHVETGSLVRCLESRSCCCLHTTSPETLTQTRMRATRAFPR